MKVEQKKSILSSAAFISIDDQWYRMDLCSDDEFYYTDEDSGEQYCESYGEIDLNSPDIELYELKKIIIE